MVYRIPSPEIDPEKANTEKTAAQDIVNNIVSRQFGVNSKIIETPDEKLKALEKYRDGTDTANEDVRKKYTAEYLPYVALRHEVYVAAVEKFMLSQNLSKNESGEDGGAASSGTSSGSGKWKPNVPKHDWVHGGKIVPDNKKGESASSGEGERQTGKAEKKSGESSGKSGGEEEKSKVSRARLEGAGCKQGGRLAISEKGWKFDFIDEGALFNLPGVGQGLIDGAKKFPDGSACFSLEGMDFIFFMISDENGALVIFSLPSELPQGLDLDGLLAQLGLPALEDYFDKGKREERARQFHEGGQPYFPDDGEQQMADEDESLPQRKGEEGGRVRPPSDGLDEDDAPAPEPAPRPPSPVPVPSSATPLPAGQKNQVDTSILPFQKESFEVEEGVFQRSGMGRETDSLMAQYWEFIHSAAKVVLQETGAESVQKPYPHALAKSMVETGLGIIWSNFTPYGEGSGVTFILQGLRNDPKVLDCDTSAYALADILIAAGVEPSRLGQVKIMSPEGGHLVLVLYGQTDADTLFIETTTGERGTYASGPNGPQTVLMYNREQFLHRYSNAYTLKEESLETGRPALLHEIGDHRSFRF